MLIDKMKSPDKREIRTVSVAGLAWPVVVMLDRMSDVCVFPSGGGRKC